MLKFFLYHDHILFLLLFYHNMRFTTITPFGVTTKPLTLTEGRLCLNHRKTKLPSYWNTSFSKICLGMKIGQQIKFIVINQQANSLYSLISDGQYRKTSLGRDTLKSLIGSKEQPVTRNDLMLWVARPKPESVSSLTTKTNANPVIPGSSLVLVDIPTTSTRVEMMH